MYGLPPRTCGLRRLPWTVFRRAWPSQGRPLDPVVCEPPAACYGPPRASPQGTSEGQPVWLAVRLPVLHSPKPRAVRRDLQVHAVAVTQGERLVLGFGVSNGRVCQWCGEFRHLVSKSSAGLHPWIKVWMQKCWIATDAKDA
jgi:hypothetical protein